MKRTWPLSSNSIVEATMDSPFSPFVVGASVVSPPSAKRSFSIYSSPATVGSTVNNNYAFLGRPKAQLDSVGLESERLQTTLDTERIKHEQAISTRDSRILELEKDRRFLLESEKELQKSIQKTQIEYQRKIDPLKDENVKLAREKEELAEKVRALETEKKRLQHATTNHEQEISFQKVGTKQQLEHLQEELSRKDSLLLIKDKRISYLEEELVLSKSLKSLSKQEQASSSSSSSILTPSTSELLDRIRQLEVTNRRLCRDNQILEASSRTTKITEERLYTAECKIEALVKVEHKYNELLAEHQAMQGKHSSASEQINSAADFKDLLEKTSDLVKLQEQQGLIEAKHKAIIFELKEQKEKLLQLENEKIVFTEEKNQLRNQLLLAQGQESILRTELDLIKGQLNASERIERATQSFLANIKSKQKL